VAIDMLLTSVNDNYFEENIFSENDPFLTAIHFFVSDKDLKPVKKLVSAHVGLWGEIKVG